MSMRLSVENLPEIHYKWRMMIFKIEKSPKILGYNKAVVMKMQLLSNTPKKKHNYVAYYKAREAFDAGFAIP